MHVKKMHGCGNDFCVLPYEEHKDYSSLAIKICNRKCGIGADGLIVVKENPLEMLFYNSDGSRAPMCGNGIRCFSKYCFDKGLGKKNKLEVITGAGVMTIERTEEEPFMCKVEMGRPIFNNSMISASDELECFGRTLTIGNRYVTIYSFFMGTIHTVIFVDGFDSPILSYAEDICNHPLFVKKTNVNFVKVVNKETIMVKTFERGVGWTLACGTGCCASVVAASKLGLTKPKAKAILELGFLEIEVTKKGIVYMTGPAVEVFSTEYMEEK